MITFLLEYFFTPGRTNLLLYRIIWSVNIEIVLKWWVMVDSIKSIAVSSVEEMKKNIDKDSKKSN